MLIFCTSYVRDERSWQSRYERWLDYNLALFPDAQFAFIDDASPWLPSLPAIEVISADSGAAQTSKVAIYTFETHKGITDRDFEGWLRSFCYSVEIAKALGHDKVLHIESDAYIVSRRMAQEIARTNTGWTAYWCPRHFMPETAIQVICADQFDAVRQVGRLDYEVHFRRKVIENTLPFTRVERAGVYGNRFGEFRKTIPAYADFACQITPDIPVIPPAQHSARLSARDWLLNRFHALLYRRI
ncbi:hypothetical protein SAMN02983003_0567 [Devosia enhydra]|uniref:Uncharacterized protein n=1 Tax=Devosia enhydra TaxID=665118 RepID=A0A1K2HTN9_9HYPH|nr:hypothetical protein [Devosia enhydra]SFZ81565.1 hypothetical protein SAMN02983003_0567 [Devosia enhydra]